LTDFALLGAGVAFLAYAFKAMTRAAIDLDDYVRWYKEKKEEKKGGFNE